MATTTYWPQTCWLQMMSLGWVYAVLSGSLLLWSGSVRLTENQDRKQVYFRDVDLLVVIYGVGLWCRDRRHRECTNTSLWC